MPKTRFFGKGKEQGLQQGRAEGAQQNAIETAKRMKAKGFDIQTIADLTQLSVDDIEKL